MNINKDTYKELQKFEKHLRSAFYGSYIMGMSTKEKLDLVEISRKIGYLQGVNTACNSCVIKWVKEIGKEYFTYQKSITENKKNKKKTVVEPIEEMIEKGDN